MIVPKKAEQSTDNQSERASMLWQPKSPTSAGVPSSEAASFAENPSACVEGGGGSAAVAARGGIMDRCPDAHGYWERFGHGRRVDDVDETHDPVGGKFHRRATYLQ